MSADDREDYLINILRLTEGKGVVKTTELANYMNISPASVSEMLKILQKEGLVDYEKYKGASLTSEGLNVARTVRRKHHIMERFLTDVLDVDHETAHNEAHMAEHAISEETANRMCRILGMDPDCDCTSCSNPCSEKNPNCRCLCLTDADNETSGHISHLSSDDSSDIKKLISMGFVPGREIELCSKVSEKGARIVRMGNTSIALDYDLAKAVYMDRS